MPAIVIMETNTQRMLFQSRNCYWVLLSTTKFLIFFPNEIFFRSPMLYRNCFSHIFTVRIRKSTSLAIHGVAGHWQIKSSWNSWTLYQFWKVASLIFLQTIPNYCFCGVVFVNGPVFKCLEFETEKNWIFLTSDARIAVHQ